MTQAVDLSQLDLSNEERSILQQGQSALGAQGSSSSRAASRASSQGVLLIDSGSLSALGRHFDHVMEQIQAQIEYLGHQSEVVTMSVYDQAGHLIDNADAEIARYHRLIKQMDDLEVEFDRVRNIKDIVKSLRQRAEDTEREIDRSQPSSSSRHRDPHHSSGKHRHGHGHGHSSSRSHRN